MLELLDEMTRTLYIIVACLMIGCTHKLPDSPSPATLGKIHETAQHLDAAKKALAIKDIPGAGNEIDAGKKSNAEAGDGHNATVDWYETKIHDRDNAIIDLKKQGEADKKKLDKPIVKAALWIDGFLKVLAWLGVIFGILWAVNKFVKQIPFFGPLMSLAAKAL